MAAKHHVEKLHLVTVVGIHCALDKLTRQDVESLAVYSGVVDSMGKWLLADLLLAAELKFPNDLETRYAAMDQICKLAQAELAYSTRRRYIAAARMFPLSRRRERLTIQHHMELVGTDLTHEQVEDALDLAENGGDEPLSVAAMRMAIGPQVALDEAGHPTTIRDWWSKHPTITGVYQPEPNRVVVESEAGRIVIKATGKLTVREETW